jgi:hypothetical protein
LAAMLPAVSTTPLIANAVLRKSLWKIPRHTLRAKLIVLPSAHVAPAEFSAPDCRGYIVTRKHPQYDLSPHGGYPRHRVHISQ